MGEKRSSGMAGLVGLIICAVLIWGGRRFFPEFIKVLLVVTGILLLLAALFAILMLFLALHISKDSSGGQKSEEQKGVPSKGRSDLMELRRMTMKIKNNRIRIMSEEICRTAENILNTLKEQPDELSGTRQFFNYYLPTFRSILAKYIQLESGSVLEPELDEHVIECLQNIKSAMEKQYQNLFEDDKLDLSVEMEALTLACKRDGLLE